MKCPWCHVGTVEVVRDGLVGEVMIPGYHVAGRPLPIRMKPAPFGACNACEFCVEIRPITTDPKE